MKQDERTKYNQEHQIQSVEGFSDTLKEARKKRVKAWFAEKWDYLTSEDVLIDLAAFCIAITIICAAFGAGKWFFECVKVSQGGN